MDVLVEAVRNVDMTTEVVRYMQNLVVFLRRHRAVASGVTPEASRAFELLIRCLSPLHELTFATPSLAALAISKIFRHRLAIVAPDNEWSLQYGSDIRAVESYLRGLTADMVIQDVLETVEVPS